MAIRKIEIYRVAQNGFTVIADGDRCTSLQWEEMLGHIAQLSLNGTPRFREPLSTVDWHWRWQPKLLLQENPKV